MMNINDSNMGNFKYRINIEGKNTVTGITPDNKNNKNGEKAEKDISCSKLSSSKMQRIIPDADRQHRQQGGLAGRQEDRPCH